MTHNNGFYHESTIPITTAEITVKYVAIETTTATIDLIATFLHPTHTVSEHKVNKGFKDDRNVDQCSLEVLLHGELKRENGKR